LAVSAYWLRGKRLSSGGGSGVGDKTGAVGSVSLTVGEGVKPVALGGSRVVEADWLPPWQADIKITKLTRRSLKMVVFIIPLRSSVSGAASHE
jgi:hypothetical protein